MTTTSKLALSAMVAGAMALGQVAQATIINGTVSFAGNVAASSGLNGTGTLDANYTTAESLVFGSSVVNSSPAPTGTFSSINTASGKNSVTVFSPLNISPLNVPSGTLLWTISSQGEIFTFTLTSALTELGAPSQNTLILSGVGTMADNLGDTSNSGTWIATFTSATTGTNATFSWNSSSQSTNAAPEAGTSVLLLGLGLAALGAYAQFRKQVA